MKRRLRLATLVFGVLVVVGMGLAWAPKADANFATALSGYCYYSSPRKCTADSYRHDFDWDLGPRMGSATFDSLYNTYDTTDLEILLNGSVNDSTHSENVDVYFRADLVVGGWAKTSCQDPVDTSHWCNHNHVIFDTEEMVDTLDSDAFLKKAACHEIGHSVGLTHPSADNHGVSESSDYFGCMRPGVSTYPYLGAHGASHIDAYYLPF